MLILLVVPFADTYQEQEQSLYHPLAYSDNWKFHVVSSIVVMLSFVEDLPVKRRYEFAMAGVDIMPWDVMSMYMGSSDVGFTMGNRKGNTV